jgi:glycosyltransferase involved in cell wall biosynthesis
MEDRKNILIFAGCRDGKLISKISPILDSSLVKEVYLVRNKILDYSHPKLKQYPPLKLFSKILVLREFNRIVNGIYILFTKEIDILIGIHYIMHGIYTHFLARLFKKKYIFLYIESPRKYKRQKKMFKRLSKASAIGVRGSSSRKYLIEKGIPEEKIFIPPNEFEIPNVEIVKGEKKYHLIYIGNFGDVKDLPLWVDIVQEIKRSLPNIKGVMLGDGKRYEDIKSKIQENGLESNIELVGRQKDVYKYLNRSKLLLMTSTSEGLPMVVVEAMSVGVPSVIPDIGDVTDLVRDNENGVVIDSRNPKEFAKKIISLLNDKQLYEKLQNESIKSVKQMSENTTHEKLVELWDLVLKRVIKEI